ncbi:MAG: hypothetical protein AB7G75_08185 [Candidatus Binatia bacterium]
MAKAASSTTTKRATTTKSATTPAKPRARTQKVPVLSPPVSAAENGNAVDLSAVTDRLVALEERLTHSFASVAAEIQAVKSTPPQTGAEDQAPPETVLPIIADLIRRSLTEQLAPIVASLKRLEERVGFIGNRLKHPGSGQEQRQKPWRHEQQQRHNRPRNHNGPSRPGQGQQWSPPNAASVQGHFAPRPLHGGVPDLTTEEDEQ